MTLTDAQLGRIARAASDNLLDARDVGVIVDYANKGELANAIRWLRCSPRLTTVLREVAAEVEREYAARCELRITVDGSHWAVDGQVRRCRALDAAFAAVKLYEATAARLIDPSDGTEWTWKRESER